MPTKRKISIFFGFGWPSTYLSVRKLRVITVPARKPKRQDFLQIEGMYTIDSQLKTPMLCMNGNQKNVRNNVLNPLFTNWPRLGH